MFTQEKVRQIMFYAIGGGYLICQWVVASLENVRHYKFVGGVDFDEGTVVLG